MNDDFIRSEVLRELRPGGPMVYDDGSNLPDCILDVAADYELDPEVVRKWVHQHEGGK